MGFQKPNSAVVKDALRKIMGEIHSPYNDGYTQSYCKQDLYVLKCWLDQEYNKLPTFVGEELWEQEQIIQLLKQE